MTLDHLVREEDLSEASMPQQAPSPPFAGGHIPEIASNSFRFPSAAHRLALAGRRAARPDDGSLLNG
jgi:hypothetical protein